MDLKNYIEWIGNFHFVFLHFPIALIIMTGFAELFFAYTGKVFYSHAARFMLIAAAIFAIPTALSGLALGWDATETSDLYWHRILGIFTALFALFTLFLREKGFKRSYKLALLILFISVNITASIGGEMTFGEGFLNPPFMKS